MKPEFKNKTLTLRPDNWDNEFSTDECFFSAKFVPEGRPLVIQDWEGDRIALNPEEAAELMVYLAKVLGVVKP